MAGIIKVRTPPGTRVATVEGFTTGISNPYASAALAKAAVEATTGALDWAYEVESDYDRVDYAYFDSAGAPSGAAGGDLEGTYPNPTLVADGLPVKVPNTFADGLVRRNHDDDGWLVSNSIPDPSDPIHIQSDDATAFTVADADGSPVHFQVDADADTVIVGAADRFTASGMIDANPNAGAAGIVTVGATNYDVDTEETGIGGTIIVTGNTTAMKVRGPVGFYDTTPIAKPTVAGMKVDAVAGSILAALVALGLVIDTTT